MIWDGEDFSGTKVALICGDQLVTYLRDDKASIPYPAKWDLPGGGREGDETPIACGLRETEEEFGLRLSEDRVLSLRRYPARLADGLNTYFCVAHIGPDEVAAIVFGHEGQHWRMMLISEFIAHPDAVPHLRSCVEEALFR